MRLEILRALSFNPRVLILDEPTGVLAPSELGAFLELLRRLRGEGRIVILVTHKLAEAMAVADRVTVLRHGHVAAERIAANTNEAELARLMIGEIAAPLAPSAASFANPDALATPVLTVERLTLDCAGRRVLDGLDFTLSTGEIVGLAGVDGNGQRELVELIAGLRTATSGRLHTMPHDAAIAVIPQDRDLDGLILDMPLWENLILARPLRDRFTRCGWLRRAGALAYCGEVLERFRIRSAGAASTAASLSGGNRQRLAVARALSGEPQVLVAHDVCRGLDLRATADVHRMLREFAATGGAVLLISSDLDELLALSTRLLVICRGRVLALLADNCGAEHIGLMMSGAAS